MSITDKIAVFVGRISDISEICDSVCEEVFTLNADDCVYQVRRQLMEGMGGDGTELVPKYLEDTYFSTVQKAENYVAWKIDKGIGVPANGSPNLYINGTFHKSLFLDVSHTACSIESSASFGDEVFAKYGKDKFGISEEFYINNIKGQIIDGLKRRLYEGN